MEPSRVGDVAVLFTHDDCTWQVTPEHTNEREFMVLLDAGMRGDEPSQGAVEFREIVGEEHRQATLHADVALRRAVRRQGVFEGTAEQRPLCDFKVQRIEGELAPIAVDRVNEPTR